MNSKLLTIEQEKREALWIGLQRALPHRNKVEYEAALNGGTFWLHFVDLSFEDVGLLQLFDEGLIERDPYYPNAPKGTFDNQFPPNAYRLTMKSRRILCDVSLWVFNGELASEDDVKRAAEAYIMKRVAEGR